MIPHPDAWVFDNHTWNAERKEPVGTFYWMSLLFRFCVRALKNSAGCIEPGEFQWAATNKDGGE